MVMKSKLWILICMLVIVGTVAACAPVAAPSAPAAPTTAPAAPAAPAATTAPAAPAATTAPAAAEGSWWAQAAKDAGCVGKTIRGVTESTPPSKFAADPIGKEFTKETGINLELETTSWDQMYDKAIKDMEAGTGIYDFVYIEQDIIYQYLAKKYLVDITQALKDNPKLANPDFSPDKFTSFINYFKDANGDLYGVPMEAFIKPYLYRTDLFGDPEIQAAFKAKYNRDLKPATTHAEYQDNADFFTQWGKDHNMELWGSTVQAHTSHASSLYEFVESIAPSWGVYNWGINLDTYHACVANGGQMNSDKAKAALKFWEGLLKDAPPESTSSTWDEVAATFAAGRAAQGWVYGENTVWIATDPTRSKVVGKVGVALPPTEPGVIDDAKAGKGYIGYYDGGAFGIPITSKNKECTVLWEQYYAQDKFQADWAVAGSRITEKATYDDPKIKEFDAKTNGYFTLMKDQGYLFAGAPPFPFHSALFTALEPTYWKSLTGEITPEAALDQMCQVTEDTLKQLGYIK
jgi:multiple sugar transport system substrate-binding protein